MVSFDEIAEWAASLRAEQLPATVARRPRERDSVRAAIAAAWRTRSGRHWERVTNPGHERDAGLFSSTTTTTAFSVIPGIRRRSSRAGRGGARRGGGARVAARGRLPARPLERPGLDLHPRAGSGARGGLRAGHDAKTLSRAMGLAFLAPCSPTWGALLATQAKPARIAGPVAAGLRGAALAAEGVAPPRRALADGLAAASFAPLPSLLGGLGERWLLSTLCFKPRPGCAYLQAALAALAGSARSRATRSRASRWRPAPRR